MNQLLRIFSPEFIEATGWTIVHSLWQASAIAIGLGLILLLIGRKSAQIKYFISFVALVGVLVWSAVTFAQSYRYAEEKQAIKLQLVNNPYYIKSLLQTTSDRVIATADVSIINIKLIKTRAFFQRNFNWICFVWICGMLLLIIRLVGEFAYTRHLRTYQLTPLADEWLLRIEDIAQKLGIGQKVAAFYSPLATVPITLGTIKPLILFPVTAFTGLSISEIEAIIAHELTHILRKDYLFNIFQSIVELLFFYHPAVWLISANIRFERENSCDNIAIEATGDKIAYAKALAAIMLRQQQENPKLTMAFSVNKNSVLQRIKRIQKQITMKTNFFEGIIAAAVIVVGLTLASFTIGTASKAQLLDNDSKFAAQTISKAKSDSIRTEFEHRVTASQTDKASELKKVAELAYSENDTVQSAEITRGIDRAMREIDIEKILQEAMASAQEAMKNASLEVQKARTEIDRDELKRDMEEAQRDIEASRIDMETDIRRDMRADGADEAAIELAVKAASAGLDVAVSVVGNLDLEGIINSALSGTSKALGQLAKMNIDSMGKAQKPRTEAQIKLQMEKLETQKKQLDSQQKELKKKMKELEKQRK